MWESWDFHFLLDRSEVTPEMKRIMQRWPNIKILSSKLGGDDVLGLVTSEVGGADDYANNRQKYARR